MDQSIRNWTFRITKKDVAVLSGLCHIPSTRCFWSDAAKTQCFYISNGLKKPNWVPIRQFVQRIQQLNGYLNLLPCLFYSKHATKLTKVVQAFDDVDLASHILQMVPRNWQDQYKLTVRSVPQSVRKLLEALECIKKAYPTEKEWEGPKANTTGGGSSKKRMVTFSDWIPKKSRQGTKHCALCKKHGGTHNTHNTGDCKKFNSDGTPKKARKEDCKAPFTQQMCVTWAECKLCAVVHEDREAWKI